jgi:uncharacterized membrane protein YdbT with pleckstrin-like domain
MTYRIRDESIATVYGIHGRRIVYPEIRRLQVVPTSNYFTKLEDNVTAVEPQ